MSQLKSKAISSLSLTPFMASHNRHGFHLHRKPIATNNHTTLVPRREELKEEMKKHEQRQHLAQATALAVGAFALHEKHQAKKHPENAHSHKMKEHIAGAVAVGVGAAALHEKHEKNHAKKLFKHSRHA